MAIARIGLRIFLALLGCIENAAALQHGPRLADGSECGGGGMQASFITTLCSKQHILPQRIPASHLLTHFRRYSFPFRQRHSIAVSNVHP